MQEAEKHRLIRRAQEGDNAAFEELIRSNKTYIAHIAYTTLSNRHDAEDAIQEAVLSIYKSISQLKNVRSFDAWVYQIVYNACMVIGGKIKRDQQPIGDDEENTFTEDRIDLLPIQSSEQKEASALLLEKIRELPEKQRLALSLFFFEEMSYKDIAKIMNAGVRDVANWIFRAKGKLKESLNEDGRTAEFRRPIAVDAATISSALALDVQQTAVTDRGESVEAALWLIREGGEIIGGAVIAASIAFPFKILAVAGAALMLTGTLVFAFNFGGAGEGEQATSWGEVGVPQGTDQDASKVEIKGAESGEEDGSDTTDSAETTSSSGATSEEEEKSGAIHQDETAIKNTVTYEELDPSGDSIEKEAPPLTGESNTALTVLDTREKSLAETLGIKTGDLPWLTVAAVGVVLAGVGVAGAYRRREE